MVEKIESYKQLTDKFVPEQYKASERLLGMLDSMFSECDNLENAFFEIFESLNLETAVGPALDFLGAIVGVERKLGEADEAYRERIYNIRNLEAAPTYEGVREMLKLVTGQDHIYLFPCWPAGFYWVPPHAEEYNLAQLISESVTSGVDTGAGTFLCLEEGEDYGLLMLEDNDQPLVVDQRWPDTLYELVDENGDYLVDSEGNHIVALDYLTTF